MLAASAATAAAEAAPELEARFPPFQYASVERTSPPKQGAWEFVFGPVEKIRRDVIIDRKVRFTGVRETATYRVGAGRSPEDAFRHYRAQLSGEVLFECRARDCGRSNYWANYVFDQADLYGLDRNQYYFAAEVPTEEGGVLVAVYAVERGNKRVYVHVETFVPDDPVRFASNADLLARLSGHGQVVVAGIAPLEDGSLPADAAARLSALATELAPLAGRTIYVVCHLYGRREASDLLRASKDCGESAAQLLNIGSGPAFVGIGIGPLAPAGARRSRIELVLPHLLERS